MAFEKWWKYPHSTCTHNALHVRNSLIYISQSHNRQHSQLEVMSHIYRPYSRQVIEWIECDVSIHPPSSVYPKAGNGALRGQWAIEYHCKNDSPTIVFTVRDLVHWNYVTSENISRVCKLWKSLLIYVLATYIFFLFIRHSVHCN